MNRISHIIRLSIPTALALMFIDDAHIAHSLRGQIALESSERLICV
ncbi:MAG: hypothetical protein K2M83_08905 [Muribaculaceae bacterium]|nr:hypothetical protein [Muribaculaceae bacterium]